MKDTIEITGHTLSDLQIALEAAGNSIARGNWMGFDRNDTGSYHFDVDGEAAESYAVAKGGDLKSLGEERFNDYYEALEMSGSGDEVVGIGDEGRAFRLED